MKKLIKPASLLLYFLAFILFLFVGMIFAALTGAGENQGLAAGAIVVGYGVITAVIAFVAALFTAYYVPHKTVIRLNQVFTGLLVICLLFFTYRYFMLQREAESQPTSPEKPPKAAPMTLPAAPAYGPDAEIDMGFFKPNFFDHPVMYFYGRPNPEKSILEHPPIDSVVFAPLENAGYTITYAPPWLVPAYMKLDYDMLLFKLQAVGQDFARIEVNQRDGKTAYVDRRAGEVWYWPDFLLRLHSIEPLRPDDYPIRIKPLDHASPVNTDYSILKPVFVRNDWVEVNLLTRDQKIVDTGWIRWRHDNRLLIRYNLFS